MSKSFASLIDRWPTLRDFASDVGVAYGTAQVMRFRDRIDDRYWVAMVEAAERRGLDGVTYEALARASLAYWSTRKPRRSACERVVA